MQLKLKRGSTEFYQAYSEASHWVSNARTPLYLNKKRIKHIFKLGMVHH